jgi:hypothetical protein
MPISLGPLTVQPNLYFSPERFRLAVVRPTTARTFEAFEAFADQDEAG